MKWPANPQRWLGAGLLASLALNAFFVGITATEAFRTTGKDNSADGRLRFELRWLSGRLPPEAVASIQAALLAARPQTQGHIDRLRELRSGLRDLAAAPAPDRAAIDARLAEIRAELDRMAADSHKTTIDALLALPAGTRAGLTAK